LLAIVV
jgi:hypothetical protein